MSGPMMTSTPPPSNQYTIPAIPSLPSPQGGGNRPRGSLGSSFSFGPGTMLDSFSYDVNASTLSAGFNPGSALDPNRSILAHSPARSSPMPKRKLRAAASARSGGPIKFGLGVGVLRTAGRGSLAGRGGRHPHPLANDTTVDVFNDSDDDADNEDESHEENYEWGMIDRMRLWRHDALMQHLYDTAAFWGDKILSWTNDPNDAFWLAQTYFMTHQYARAFRLLTRPFPTTPNAFDPSRAAAPTSSTQSTFQPTQTATQPSQTNSTPFPSLNPTKSQDSQPFVSPHKGKAKLISQTAERSVVSIPRLPMGSAGLVDVPEQLQEHTSRLVDLSLACRYLAAQCMLRSGKWNEALELIGEDNPFAGSSKSGPAIANTDGGIKIEASMCYLRGLLMLKLNRADQAKTCFMEALALDVKCADAFVQLINAEMLTPDEEWEFVQQLSYSTQTPDDAEFVQLIYTSRLRKDKHKKEQELTRMRLVDDYGLGDNPDVLFSFAEALYVHFRWAECFAITTRIMALTSLHVPTVPLHIACMYHLNHLHSKLFLMAHEMVDREPENHLSWYAVGVWYLCNAKWGQARAYLSKATLMDPRFAPAWAAFGHTFALEAEHDHAVTAYSTCARIFAGSHLPLLFIGMEQIMLSNFKLADEALAASHALCSDDPLLCNERGVMAFNHGAYHQAAALFQEAIDRAEVTQGSQKTWAVTYINLGTSLRKLKRYDEALKVYQKVVEYDSRNAMALGLLGMVHHLLHDLDSAILKYHEALSIDPINSNILELLNTALETRTNKMIPDVGKQEYNKAVKALQAKWAKQNPGAPASKITVGGVEIEVGGGTRDEDAMQI